MQVLNEGHVRPENVAESVESIVIDPDGPTQPFFETTENNESTQIATSSNLPVDNQGQIYDPLSPSNLNPSISVEMIE